MPALFSDSHSQTMVSSVCFVQQRQAAGKSSAMVKLAQSMASSGENTFGLLGNSSVAWSQP